MQISYWCYDTQKIFGEGKWNYLFLWRRRKRWKYLEKEKKNFDEEKKNEDGKEKYIFVCVFCVPLYLLRSLKISWDLLRSLEISQDLLRSIELPQNLLESHNDNVDNFHNVGPVDNFGSLLRKSEEVSESRWQNLWSINQWINPGFTRWHRI